MGGGWASRWAAQRRCLAPSGNPLASKLVGQIADKEIPYDVKCGARQDAAALLKPT